MQMIIGFRRETLKVVLERNDEARKVGQGGGQWGNWRRGGGPPRILTTLR